MKLPPCGLYRTTESIGGIPARRLVFFHNHGDPGPGLYLPESWAFNRARFSRRGTTLPAEELAHTLEPLPPEGLYRVLQRFTCCEKRCTTYEQDLLVQLGYNGAGEPILFVPEWTERGLAFPETGTRLDPSRLPLLSLLRVAGGAAEGVEEPGPQHLH